MWPPQETVVQRLGKVFRAMNSGVLDEPLPTRWVELIHHLNELELRRSRHSSDRPSDDPKGEYKNARPLDDT